MTESTILTPEFIGGIVTIIIGVIGGTAKFTQFKTKLSGISNAIKEIDAALADDKVTPEEARRIVAALRGIIK